MSLLPCFSPQPHLLHRLATLILAGLACSFAIIADLRAESTVRSVPNILLILADDLGWSDLGCYGGEIATPHLDRLAKGGLRFTQFYNSARCSPTRAAILTGLHPHQAGFPNLQGTLPKHCVTLPEALRPAGYQTFMVGKWHLSEQTSPTGRGFDEFYGMLGGYNTFWRERPFYSRLPEGSAKRTYREDEFYATNVFGDYALDFLQQARAGDRPWFLYLAFNAPHFPLHAPESVVAKYEALYRAKGWDTIRAERFAKQKELKLLPADAKLSPREKIPANRFNRETGWADKELPAWDTLPEERRVDLARRMAVYAAMVDVLDQNVGRVLAELEKTKQLDNTLIFFLSDNGACAEWDPYGFDGSSGPKNTLHRGDDLKAVGGPDSYISYGCGWASACNTPWRLYKHYNHEGGVRTPLMVHWPRGVTAGLTHEPGYITDFMPTLLELAGAKYPAERDGVKILPPEGVSLTPTFRGEKLLPRTIAIEHEGNRSLRDGDWKLVAVHDQPWELYHLAADPTELVDLAEREPERVRSMSAAWEAWAKRCRVVHEPTKTASPPIANRPLVIRCDVTTEATEGVILAQGGRRYGYALHLRAGRPVFSVRQDEKLFEIAGEDKVAGKFTLEAKLARDGGLSLAVNGREVATGKAPGLIGEQPVDPLTIGADTQTAVGDYDPPHALAGKVERVKVTAP